YAKCVNKLFIKIFLVRAIFHMVKYRYAKVIKKKKGEFDMSGFNTKVTPELEALTRICEENSKMDVSLYGKYDVKRGLRDVNGKGVLAGLTQISNIVAYEEVDGKQVPCDGRL